MTNKPKIAVLIVAAGTGERFGGIAPKQYLPLLGRPVLRWSIDAFLRHPAIADVYVVIHADHQNEYAAATAGLKLPAPIIGGATRQESVRMGLEKIAAFGQPDFILIHDAARPGISAALISSICAALEKNDAVVPGVAISDTLRRKTGDTFRTENREGLYAIQTPQAFRFAPILALHTNADRSVTDDAALCEAAGQPLFIVDGERNNFKVTQGDDLILMEQALASRCGDIRTGSGYDVHKLVAPENGRKLMICGIEVAHTHVLDGHSDADVGLHAITDALLATICDGDIGMHFSPKENRWKGADSAKFLRHAADLVAAQDGVITHIDVTIICEAPKIGPQRDKMRARIAEILALPAGRISVKATTTEGLGFTGRREGIAAESVVTVRLPFGAATAMATQDDIRKWGT